jgi:hypothetical protein
LQVGIGPQNEKSVKNTGLLTIKTCGSIQRPIWVQGDGGSPCIRKVALAVLLTNRQRLSDTVYHRGYAKCRLNAIATHASLP